MSSGFMICRYRSNFSTTLDDPGKLVFHFYTASVFIQYKAHGIPSIYWTTVVISNANKRIFFLSFPESLYIFLYPKATYCRVAMQWMIALNLLLTPIKEILFPVMKIFCFIWAWQCFFCSGDISVYIFPFCLACNDVCRTNISVALYTIYQY